MLQANRRLWCCTALASWAAVSMAGQSQEAISQFFEGKHVTLKMDMPGTQQGVDVFPQRPQTLDMKSYASRLKRYGVAIHNGDSIMVTKVKVKDNSIEFQLGGGGFGTAGDDSDTSVHFTPESKSDREKELEDQLNSETDPDKRRSLQRELDYVRSRRERDDQRARTAAEDAAEFKKQRVASDRLQGGSRFNIRFNAKRPPSEITPETIMSALSPYVSFPDQGATQSASGVRSDPAGPPPPQPPVNGSPQSLRKGMTFEQVEALVGAPTESHDKSQNGLAIHSCTFQSKDSTVQADFVNGVLVQFTVSSR